MKRVRPWVLLSVVSLVLLVICVGGTLISIFTSLKPDQEILDAMSEVCEGKGVEEAAVYDLPGSGPHAIVLLDASGSGHAWTGMLPYNWQPKSINTIELVACLDEEQEELIDICEHYSSGQTIRRYQYTITIRLVAARSGETIATGVITGEPPRACQIAELVDTTEIHGPHVTSHQAVQWLTKFVTP